MQQLQHTTRSPAQQQSQIIKDALIYLASQCDGAATQDGHGFNGTDAVFGHNLATAAKNWGLSPRQEFEACKMMRKYWRQLKTAGISLPKPYLNQYRLNVIDDEQAIVVNESKGSEYKLIRDSWGDYTCECEAASNGNVCGHVAFAQQQWVFVPPPEPAALPPIPVQIVEPAPTELEILPGIFATQGQAQALEDLMDFAQGGNTLHLLSGFAGTGKTVLLQAWLKRLRDSGNNAPVVFTAPTNKATEVLRSMTMQWGLNVECVTCAKLLGLRPIINRETGKEEFKKNYAEDSVIQDYAIVVVDEASMVSEDLFQYTAEEANILTKILFVGDWAQLPPVGEPISKAFLAIKEQSALTEVKRYSGAIAVVADDLRCNLARRGEPLIETDTTPDKTKGTFVLDEDKWKDALIKAFKSENSAQDPNYCRALAWRNKTVEGLNQYIREHIQGHDAPRFVVGERLLAGEHYGIKDAVGRAKPLFSASAEMEVLEIAEGTSGDWRTWFLHVVMLDGEGLTHTIPVLHEDELKRFEAEQKKVKQGALKGDKHLWDRYFENRKTFAWVDYAYAMTVHKSQGSTFSNVFIDMGDIMANNSKAHVVWPSAEKQLVYERNQLLYVAITRASQRIFIFE